MKFLSLLICLIFVVVRISGQSQETLCPTGCHMCSNDGSCLDNQPAGGAPGGADAGAGAGGAPGGAGAGGAPGDAGGAGGAPGGV